MKNLLSVAAQWWNRNYRPIRTHPKFLRELHKARHEKREATELLEQNFLKDDRAVGMCRSWQAGRP